MLQSEVRVDLRAGQLREPFATPAAFRCLETCNA
jgi:hypothetical protein